MTTPAQIQELHAKAMDLAGRASLLQMRGGKSADRLFRQAFALERKAAEALAFKFDAEPSRSVLLRSAASLALDCKKYRDSEQLIALALSGNPPQEICEELRDLLETVYFSRHLEIKGMTLAPVEFQMCLVGSSVAHGLIESHEFLHRAADMQNLLIRTIERKNLLPFRETGGADKQVLKGFEIYFAIPKAASYSIKIRVGQPDRQLRLKFPELVEPVEVIENLLTCLEDFAADNVKSLRNRIPDEAYFNNFTSLARNLAPDGERIKVVGFTKTIGSSSRIVSLKHPPSQIWKQRAKPVPVEQFVGRIRFADETPKHKSHPIIQIELLDGTISPKVQVRPGLLQDIVKPYWGDLVRVFVSKPKNGGYQLDDLEPFIQSSSDMDQG